MYVHMYVCVCMFVWCVYMCGYILSPPPFFPLFFLFVKRSSYALGHLCFVLKFTVIYCKFIFAFRSFPCSALVSREVWGTVPIFFPSTDGTPCGQPHLFNKPTSTHQTEIPTVSFITFSNKLRSVSRILFCFINLFVCLYANVISFCLSC